MVGLPGIDVPIRNTPFAQAVTQQARGEGGPLHRMLPRHEVKDLVETHNIHPNDYVGKGTESVVIRVPGRQMVEAIKFGAISEADAHKLYDTHRILAWVFRDNFPKFFGFQGVPKDLPPEQRKEFICGSVREYIPPTQEPTQTLHPFRTVETTTKQLGLPLEFDTNPQHAADNLRVAENGNEYYLDVARITGRWSEEHRQALDSYMQQMNFDPKRIALVDRVLSRLIQNQYS